MQVKELRENLAQKRQEVDEKNIEDIDSGKESESSDESDMSQGDGGISMNTTQNDSEKRSGETNHFKSRI